MARSPVVRARQRDRQGSLIGFDPDLVPLVQEWCLDRIIIEVGGVWQSRNDTGFSLFETRLSVPDLDWFGLPQRKPRSIEMRSRADAAATLGSLTLSIFNAHQSYGNLKVRLDANPTRTLAHLVARWGGDDAEFTAWLGALRPEEFFAAPDEDAVSPSLDRNDNWLPEPRRVRALLGSEVFAAFLPIYIGQLQRMVALVLLHNEDVRSDGTDLVLEDEGSRIAVGWGDVNVPQIEWYFERYHARAVTAVRHGAVALLAADHNVQVQTYASRAALERDNDCFRVAVPISSTRRLAVYAKSPDRIRFEVRRHGRGYYRGRPIALTPTDRLSWIVTRERIEAERCMRWQTIGELFSGPDEVSFGDLAHLITNVLAVFPPATPMGAKALMLLLEEGGFSSDQVRNRNGINALVRHGIIAHVKTRSRDMSGRAMRYTLRAPYRGLHDLLAGALPGRMP